VIRISNNIGLTKEFLMPIYEYDCQRCGTIEVTQRITEKPLGKCPTCRGKVKKLISNTSFQLKGTGWYITDYARKGQNGDSKSGNGSKSASESKSESSSSKEKSSADSKSESKKSESSSSKSDKSSASSSTST
jgi:putative FmdB family regulatory protein